MKELQKHTEPISIALAGNKTDLEPMRQVKFQEANSYADEKGAIFDQI